MQIRRFSLGAAAAAAVVLAGCGTAAVATHDTSGSGAAPTTGNPRPAALATTPRSVDTVTAIAEQRYDQEVRGGTVHHELRIVARDPALLAALRRGDLSAARAEANRLQAGPGHISRIQIVRGGKRIVAAGVPFVVDGPQTTLRAADGTDLGTLTVAIQDEIGVVRLIHRNYPVEVVIRGASGQVRTSLPAAKNATLPTGRGTATIGGRRYEVRSFPRRALDGEAVTVWILARA